MDKAALKELAIKTVSDAIDKGEDVSNHSRWNV
jgi:hypothetical protein